LLKSYLNDYYDSPSPAIDDATIKKYHKSVRLTLEHKKTILSFQITLTQKKVQNMAYGELDGVIVG
jgi:hypothetical protein